MKNKNTCNTNNYKRTRYFHGQLLTDRDFREEQIYHNEKRKLLNRMLHGWGVVYGLNVKPTEPASKCVIVKRGLALDYHGNEIEVCEDFTVDLQKQAKLCFDTLKEKRDPCAEREQDQECKRYIAIKYNEVPTDPVPVYAPGGGCEEKVCDYSRTREGFCVKLFKTLPCQPGLPEDGLVGAIRDCLEKENTSNDSTFNCLQEALEKFHEFFCKQPYPCPTCCCNGESYVVLGTIDFTTTDCQVTTISQDMISINESRRYVLTPMFLQYYLGSFYPPIAHFLENPFIVICRYIARILDLISTEGEVSARAETFRKMTAVYKMKETDAKKILKEQKLDYNRTITMSPDHILDIATRAIAMEKIEPKMNVDLVTDKTGNVLFYIPAKEFPEKVELETRLQEAEKAIKDLKDKIDALGKKVGK